MEDEILIKYLRKNDRKAYSILFDKYFERLFTFAVRVVFREDVANDIVQEIFISLYEKSEILNYDLSLKSYLFNSVRNRCFNYLLYPYGRLVDKVAFRIPFLASIAGQ